MNELVKAELVPADMIAGGGMVQTSGELIGIVRHTPPRDLKTIRDALLSVLEVDPRFAIDAMYRRPVGKDRNGSEKVAEGLSIRAMECIAGAWGCCDTKTGWSPVWAENGQLAGANVWVVVTDLLAANRFEERTFTSVKYKTYKGNMEAYAEDRFCEVHVRGVVSRRLRDAYKRIINPALLAWFQRKCEEVAATILDDATIIKMVAEFQAVKITKEHLERLLGCTVAEGWTKQTRLELLKWHTALRENEITVEELLSAVPAPTASTNHLAKLEEARAKRASKTANPPALPVPAAPTRKANLSDAQLFEQAQAEAFDAAQTSMDLRD